MESTNLEQLTPDYDNGETYHDFEYLLHNIRTNTKKISKNVSAMYNMVKQLQTPQDTQELRNQLRQVQTYTQMLVKDTSSLMIELRNIEGQTSLEEYNKQLLNYEYITALKSFQTTQKLAAKKSKEEVRKQRANNAMYDDQGTKDLLVLDEGNVLKQEQLTIETERDLIELEERERNVRLLENDILEVNEIFKDLGLVVHEQGEVVDSIEASVDRTTVNIDNGLSDLRDAVREKNKLRKKETYFCFAVIIVVSIIIIMIFTR
ncbi:syntaxin-7-like [Anticarsia gemmatalis]|uniref:syntaxin-7-like n=1 Tax=Anticarsia gemmatalis TaxID=129554 RepID=UPI003F76E6C2